MFSPSKNLDFLPQKVPWLFSANPSLQGPPTPTAMPLPLSKAHRVLRHRFHRPPGGNQPQLGGISFGCFKLPVELFGLWIYGEN